MEVTENNFKAELPVVLQAIRDADFLSFDCEFTGLGEGAQMILLFDTPALVYSKALENLANYTVVQFGLCTFRYDKQSGKYRHRVFNFYVFPRLPKELSGLLRKQSSQYQSFGCQADSLEFLAAQKFDFNKWIWNGVGFLRKSTVDNLKEELSQKFMWRNKNEKPTPVAMKIPDAHKGKVHAHIHTIDNFMKSSSEHTSLENIENFEKRYLINAIESKYGTSALFFSSEIDTNKNFRLKISKCDNEEKYKELALQQQQEKLQLLDDAAGFCNVITAISKSNKPLIGHNMYLDLLHTIKAFCCDLPSSYSEFKKLLREWFPKIIDTKVLGSQPAFRKYVGHANALFQLYTRLQQPPFKTAVSEAEDDAHSYKHCMENHHEAGYDAFLTGLLFIGLADYLGATCPGKEKFSSADVNIQWSILTPILNKVAPGRVLDMHFFDLGLTLEADMVPDRSHIFHLTFSSDDWVNENIKQLFSPYGEIQIGWINGNSCFITLKDRKNAKMVLKNLVQGVELDSEERCWTLKASFDFFKQQEALLSTKQNFSSSAVCSKVKKIKLG